MVVALILIAAGACYTLGSREYHKRRARKYQYDDLVHDPLGRPLDPKPPHRRLTHNEARALAQHRREKAEAARQRRVNGSVGLDALDNGNDDDELPKYTRTAHRRYANELPTFQKKPRVADSQNRQSGEKRRFGPFRLRVPGRQRKTETPAPLIGSVPPAFAPSSSAGQDNVDAPAYTERAEDAVVTST